MKNIVIAIVLSIIPFGVSAEQNEECAKVDRLALMIANMRHSLGYSYHTVMKNFRDEKEWWVQQMIDDAFDEERVDNPFPLARSRSPSQQKAISDFVNAWTRKCYKSFE